MPADMPCPEYSRLRQHYQSALRRWVQVFLTKDIELVGAPACKTAQLKQNALDDRDVANKRMCVHKLNCPTCKGGETTQGQQRRQARL
jgi:hypothetical protein